MKIDLGTLLAKAVATLGPIAKPIVIAAVTGALSRAADKSIAKAQDKIAPTVPS